MSGIHEQEFDVIHNVRETLNKLEQRFATFTQQQFSFITALDRCRHIAFEFNKEISTISQVARYAEHVSDNATDKRILNMFLSLGKDLNDFRRKLGRIARHHDDKLDTIMAKWKKTLEPTQNISQLRVSFPHSQLNHLSITESRIHFGGIISVMPTAMDCAREAVNRIDSTRSYRQNISTSGTNHESQNSFESSFSRKDRSISAREDHFEHKKTSFSVSSPVPSNTLTHGTLQSPTSPNGKESFSVRRFRSASPRLTYRNQVNMKPAGTTQTPKYLGTTVKPMLNWNHQTLSEENIKKNLKRNTKSGLARPEWKP